jgi:hypothetical protein
MKKISNGKLKVESIILSYFGLWTLQLDKHVIYGVAAVAQQ